MASPTSKQKTTLIVSDNKNPSIKLKPGQKFEVVSIKLADEELKKSGAIAARLCGGTGTCLALIETE